MRLGFPFLHVHLGIVLPFEIGRLFYTDELSWFSWIGFKGLVEDRFDSSSSELGEGVNMWYL